MNIGERSVIIGLEKTGCKLSHIEACLNDHTLHSNWDFTYYGKRVTKGTVILYTKNGKFKVRFDEENSWVRTLEILERVTE